MQREHGHVFHRVFLFFFIDLKIIQSLSCIHEDMTLTFRAEDFTTNEGLSTVSVLNLCAVF